MFALTTPLRVARSLTGLIRTLTLTQSYICDAHMTNDRKYGSSICARGLTYTCACLSARIIAGMLACVFHERNT